METFGIIGMSFGIFGLLAWIQLQTVSKELADLKKALLKSGVLGDDSEREQEKR